MRTPQGLWIVDFPPGMSEADAARYEAPFEYIRNHVQPYRERARASEHWWIHSRPRPDMRAALADLPRFIATPRVSKHRVFTWLNADVLPDCQLIVFARADDYFFGVLHSHLHEIWSLAQGTQLREKESGFRYTPTTCFETFPFPNPNPPQEQAIAATALALDAARQNWLGDRSDNKRTLTALYNEKPTWLLDGHRRLDAAVFQAYGWDPGISDERLLDDLLRLNLSRSTPLLPAAT
jgi:hypothetical protein